MDKVNKVPIGHSPMSENPDWGIFIFFDPPLKNWQNNCLGRQTKSLWTTPTPNQGSRELS